MSKMFFVISQLIRSWQKGRHFLMEPLLSAIPKDKFTTSWLKQILFLQNPYFRQGILGCGERLPEYCCSLVMHGYHSTSPPVPVLVISLKKFIFCDIQRFSFNSDLNTRLAAIPTLAVTSCIKLVPRKAQLKLWCQMPRSTWITDTGNEGKYFKSYLSKRKKNQ